MPHLSHSQVETWDQCQRKWQLQKIERAPQAPAPALIFGDAIHQALEADGQAWKETGERLTAGAMQHVMVMALGERIRRQDPDGKHFTEQQLEGILDDGNAIIAAYVDRIQANYKPLQVETDFEPVAIPGAPGWTFTGRYDARIRLASGYALLDFKTGKQWPTGEEHTKTQATAYLWAEEQTRTHGRAGIVAFLTLPIKTTPDGERICTPELRTTTRSESNRYAYAQHLREVALRIDEAKASGIYLAKTSPLCAWCPVLGSCADGMKYLRKQKRPIMVPVVGKEVEHAEAAD